MAAQTELLLKEKISPMFSRRNSCKKTRATREQARMHMNTQTCIKRVKKIHTVHVTCCIIWPSALEVPVNNITV